MRFMSRWRKRGIAHETSILLGLLDAAPNVPPGRTLVSFLSRDVKPLHGQLISDPPNRIDWTRIVVPPEAYYCSAIAWYPTDGAAVVLGDRRGRYSHAWRDFPGPGAQEFLGVWADGDDFGMEILFGTFAGFHEVFDDSART